MSTLQPYFCLYFQHRMNQRSGVCFLGSAFQLATCSYFPSATAANQSTPETFLLVIKLSHSSACLEGISAQHK